ncbi:MAG: glycoside hydrolase family 88 protein [Clostridia bacterium]|nr:glycoside hydrolase family 88 protein [Clostridia bacterium]
MKYKTPLEYGMLACDALMRMYAPEKLPPENKFFYHQGVFLSGMQNIYALSGEEKYFDYVKAYCDSLIDENGDLYAAYAATDASGFTVNVPASRAIRMLDHKQPTVLLYQLYDRTGDERYLKYLKKVAASMHFWPTNDYGAYWHTMYHSCQVWMDGAYMAGPLCVLYAKRFGDTALRERAIHQIFIMNEHTKDEKTGLYFHGWDPTKAAEWADPETGCSQEIWGRAVGWYAVAILDILENIPQNHPAVAQLKKIELDLLRALKKYRHPESGLWCQILDKPERKDNWIESSCSNLFIYSIAKAIRMGIADRDEFSDMLETAYNSSIALLYNDADGYLVIDHVCEGTCIESGTYGFYIHRKKIKNDLHGAGAFILMCAEMQRYNNFIADLK